MNNEIERKFLVKNNSWKASVVKEFSIHQGYFLTSDNTAIRARISDNGSYITIKLPKSTANVCPEFEYDIPCEDAVALIDYCEPHVIRKVRHHVLWDNHTWEVDVFQGNLLGIIVAEIETRTVDEQIILPPWVGKEVTDDIKYTNKYMAFNYV